MKIQVCIGGGAGFIGSHLAKRLKAAGWYVVCADWKANEFMEPKVYGTISPPLFVCVRFAHASRMVTAVVVQIHE